MKKRKVVIVGVGAVGQSCVFSMVNKNVANEYILIDYLPDLAKGNAYDLLDSRASLNANFDIRNGTYKDCSNADVIVITAGVSQKPGQSRIDLIDINLKIMKKIIQEINKTTFAGIILIVSNPVDILTRIAASLAKVGKKRVVGSGTSLDTFRLKSELSILFDAHPESIQSFILGEHGDTSVFAYSSSTLGGRKLSEIKKFSLRQINLIQEKIRRRAGEIIKLKKNTNFAIGSTVSRITKSILDEDKQIFALSINLKGIYNNRTDCYGGSPAYVTLTSGVQISKQVVLNEREQQAMKHSIKTLNKITNNFL